LVEFHGEGLAVEGGGQVDDVGFGGAGLHEGAVEPGAGVTALEDGFHVAVVLEVVADDEGGAVGSGAPAADALAGAEGLDGDAVAEDDAAGTPDGPATGSAGVIAGEQFVVEEFGFEVFEVGGGLVGRVGDDPDVGFAGEEGLAEGVGEGGDGGLGSAAGSEDV